MNSAMLRCLTAGAVCLGAACAQAQDWPQWRGPNGDARAAGFEAPKTWPKELKQKWKVAVGDGVATPALVGDRLYVFSRQDGQEVLRCLKADSGEEVWADKYKAATINGPARGFPGPRCSPAVAGGKVVTLGVHGGLACFDAASGKPLWRKDEFKGSVPGFYTSSSPVIVGGLCVAQLGRGRGGVIAAYDLATGKEKWNWTSDGTAYASPTILTLGDAKVIVAETSGSIVALGGEGKPLWKTAYKTRYNASSPVTAGDKVVYAGTGKGTTAVELGKSGDELKATELWNNPDFSVIYNTPVVKGGLVYGLSDKNRLFCLSMKDGKTAWDVSLGTGGGRGGYGSIVDAGSVMVALTPAGDLVVFAPSAKAFEQIAKYPVGKSTYAYPVLSGKRIFIKDADSVALWSVAE